eukprot:GHVT01076452.1.p2 GENE.GHVT01076452.1~~GHVT01076452.1.p2  ORF type:complete len:124 (-),score=6.09 GHVT01076452.1:508-879(-)
MLRELAGNGCFFRDDDVHDGFLKIYPFLFYTNTVVLTVLQCMTLYWPEGVQKEADHRQRRGRILGPSVDKEGNEHYICCGAHLACFRRLQWTSPHCSHHLLVVSQQLWSPQDCDHNPLDISCR